MPDPVGHSEGLAQWGSPIQESSFHSLEKVVQDTLCSRLLIKGNDPRYVDS